MKKINKQRCNTDKFKKQASINMKKRYEDKMELEKHSKKIREAWKNQDLRNKQKEIVKKSWEKRNGQPKLKIPHIIEINDKKIKVESRKEVDEYLLENFNYKPDRKTLNTMIKEKIPLKTNRKRLQHIVGMKIYRYDEDVETKADECKLVGLEIGANSKCEAID